MRRRRRYHADRVTAAHPGESEAGQGATRSSNLGKQELTMSSISIIGVGTMARLLGTLAVKGGNEVEVIGRDAAKAADLTGALGRGATAARIGAAPAGDIVILAVPYASAAPVVSQYGDALAGKVIVDISNPFNPEGTGLDVPDGSSIAHEVAKAAPASARVIKAFNTIFGNVLAQGRPLDVFIAGDDAQAKASLSALIASMGLRPRDTGDLRMAHWLEGAGLLMIGLGRYGVGNYSFSLDVNLPG
jgi:8-hydroxy-5-deazaflavin:NADPH oxidoreductase